MYLLVFQVCINEMHCSGSKIPSKKSRQAALRVGLIPALECYSKCWRVSQDSKFVLHAPCALKNQINLKPVSNWGTMEEYRTRAHKAWISSEIHFYIKTRPLLISFSWQNHLKYGYRTEKTGVYQAKWLTVTWIFGSRMGKKLTALLQTFMDHG
jgi:hypothetical protein